jgi:hypothetical protein
MTSQDLSKSFGRSLLLVSAALLLHSGSVVAQDLGGDAQTQARALLAGTPASRSAIVAASSAVPNGAVTLSGPDPQAQARQFILGNKSFVFPGPPAAPSGAPGRGDRRASADAQQLAGRVLRGTII